MQSTYVINVARNHNIKLPKTEPRWLHYFRVEISGEPEREVKKVYNDLRARFPECKVTVTHWDVRGETQDW